MEKQKLLKPKGKTVVICDYREREVPKFLEKFGALVNTSPLAIGDFICSDRMVVERKDHSDFVSSIVDGRIFDQAGRMKQSFDKPIFIIEGNSNRNITINALKAAVATLAANYNASIISTKNPKDTALTIFWLAKKEQHENKRELAVRVKKKSKDVKKLKEQIVCGLPGVSSVISKRLLEKFKTIEGVFSASEEELKEIEGIGKKLAKRISDVITKKY